MSLCKSDSALKGEKQGIKISIYEASWIWKLFTSPYKEAPLIASMIEDNFNINV